MSSGAFATITFRARLATDGYAIKLSRTHAAGMQLGKTRPTTNEQSGGQKTFSWDRPSTTAACQYLADAKGLTETQRRGPQREFHAYKPICERDCPFVLILFSKLPLTGLNGKVIHPSARSRCHSKSLLAIAGERDTNVVTVKFSRRFSYARSARKKYSTREALLWV